MHSSCKGTKFLSRVARETMSVFVYEDGNLSLARLWNLGDSRVGLSWRFDNYGRINNLKGKIIKDRDNSNTGWGEIIYRCLESQQPSDPSITQYGVSILDSNFSNFNHHPIGSDKRLEFWISLGYELARNLVWGLKDNLVTDVNRPEGTRSLLEFVNHQRYPEIVYASQMNTEILSVKDPLFQVKYSTLTNHELEILKKSRDISNALVDATSYRRHHEVRVAA